MLPEESSQDSCLCFSFPNPTSRFKAGEDVRQEPEANQRQYMCKEWKDCLLLIVLRQISSNTPRDTLLSLPTHFPKLFHCMLFLILPKTSRILHRFSEWKVISVSEEVYDSHQNKFCHDSSAIELALFHLLLQSSSTDQRNGFSFWYKKWRRKKGFHSHSRSAEYIIFHKTLIHFTFKCVLDLCMGMIEKFQLLARGVTNKILFLYTLTIGSLCRIRSFRS